MFIPIFGVERLDSPELLQYLSMMGLDPSHTLFIISVFLTLGVIVGSNRSVFLGLLEIVFALIPALPHPIFWDEVSGFPLPHTEQVLLQSLRAGEAKQVLRLLRNRRRRWVVQRALVEYINKAPNPVEMFYNLLSAPILNEYVTSSLAPLFPQPPSPSSGLSRLLTSRVRDELRSTLRKIFLGEIAVEFVGHIFTGPFWLVWDDKIRWLITRHFRNRQRTGITALARLLLSLEEDKSVNEQDIISIYRQLRKFSYGKEIALCLLWLTRASEAMDLEQITIMERGLEQLTALQLVPYTSVLDALRGLWDVSIEIARFREATGPADQAAALNRATGMLADLEKFVEGIVLPERVLLLRVVRRWQEVVAEAAGRLGERALREMAPAARRALAGGERRATFWSRPAEPFPSPYQAGRPVRPPLFVGRQDVLALIWENWTGKSHPDSIILYGHRRMGKTSILRNLDQVVPPGSLLVYADLKGQAAYAEGTHHLLRELAQEVAWAAQDRELSIPDPSPTDYPTPADASLAFRRLLREVLAALPEEESGLILALDEFEKVDTLVQDPEKSFGPELYDFLRDISFQDRVALVLAGLHTLDEMSRDYRHAFHESYVNIHISYLYPEAAERLITRPTPDFRLNYHPEVVARIIEATHGQPLLIQRICMELVHHLNHELFDLEKEREARVLPEDLEAVLTDEFIREETRYFEGIWRDQIGGHEAEEAVLGALASGPMTEQALAHATGLSSDALREALKYLKTRDLVERDAAGQWDLLVPLMRRWLQLHPELWSAHIRNGGDR